MSRERSRFAGGDQAYLQTEQYATSARLAVRANLHRRYSTAVEDFNVVAARWVDLRQGNDVLEVGCGAGWLWEQSAEQAPVPGDVQITLSDYSAGMVAEAVERVESLHTFASVTGRQADAQGLPFADRSFDRVVANHMLYHLPDPERGVAEIARVLGDDGTAVIATNGRRHMAELWAIRAAVFGTDPVDQTVDVFGAETGLPILRRHFANVRWVQAVDSLRCTGESAAADVLGYICSTPPAESATDAERDALERAVRTAFERGGGTMIISKDTGCFVCRVPIR